MTEDYCPTDNALAERVNGIIKQEWLYRMKRPKGTREARELIRSIVDFYNNRRPHMGIGMKTPAQMRTESTPAA
jgi:transposase InsO family protein